MRTIKKQRATLPPKRGRLLNWLLLTCALFWAATAASAQGVGSSRGDIGGTGGRQTIQGKLYFSGDKPAKPNFRVRLESTNSTTLVTITDGDGNFSFNGLGAGPYTITVEGNNEYESAVERLEIDRGEQHEGRRTAGRVRQSLPPIWPHL
jgi:hypothetical protein